MRAILIAFLLSLTATFAVMQTDGAAAPKAEQDVGKRKGVSRNAARPVAPVGQLIVPVARVARGDLDDTWGDARSEGRSHQGIDIRAPEGRAVVAVADGRIVKFFDSDRGGVTIYQFDQSERFVFYYAHLSRRAPGLSEGEYVRQGQVIGAVGRTGNANVSHLHFEIQRLGRERRWWIADAMNPYPYLSEGRAPT